MFSAVSGFETGNKDTKTVYSGDTYTNDKGVTYERIEWEAGDKIKIYCHTGNNKQAADYSVGTATTSTNQTHTAVLNKHDEDNGIHWNGTGKHRFYAIYPSPTMPDKSDSKTTLEGKVDITYDENEETAILQGYVPTTQAPIAIIDDKNITNNGTVKRTADYWAKPDMRYSYMVASTTATPNTDNSNVNLTFSAVATALEIDIVAPIATTISEVIIQSISGAPLTGNFTCPIDQDGKPKTSDIQISEGASTVNIQLGSHAMKANETLRITALLLPLNVKAGDLNIIVQTDKLMRGNLEGVSLTAHKKHYLTNVRLKTDIPGNNWVSMLNPKTLLKGLSIPGTSNSFSSSYQGDNSNYYKTQTKSLVEQWNMGVRCFEFVSDRGADAYEIFGIQIRPEEDLEDEQLMCSDQVMGVTFGGAFDQINQLAKESNEFAMIICTYQPLGNDVPRDPVKYMNQLKEFYDSRKADANFVLYSPGLTIEDVQKGMMVVARPSQEGEDTDDVVNNAIAGTEYNILTIKGWGSLPDKWWRRGYPVQNFKGYSYKNNQGAVRFDQRSGFGINYKAIEDWIYGTNYGQLMTGGYTPYATDRIIPDINAPATIRPQKDVNSRRFNYNSDASDFNVWAQEWRRVVNSKTLTDNQEYSEYVELSGTISSSVNYNYCFHDTVDEKKGDIEYTFERSISDSSEEFVYFNSLSGFYMLKDNLKSFSPYWEGAMGDISSYSSDINKWFYGVVQKKGEANITGPLGVTIIDRAGETTESSELVRIIIANNFKFNMPTSDQ